LTNEIIAGKYPVGSLLPTRAALVKRFSVARATIDNAVRDLVNAGMIQSRRGAGSIIINTTHLYRIAVIGNDLDTLSRIRRNDATLIPLSPENLTTRSAREKLRQFDGVIWNMPGEKLLSWAESIQQAPPQIILNRTPDNLNYISINHTNAIFEITNERLDKNPDWLPVFLNTSSKKQSAVLTMREDGFTKACRKHRVFYEIINMPTSFEHKIKILHKQFDNRPKEKLIIVSGTVHNTGAVMIWARETGRYWQKDLLYSDFDNNFDNNIWGATVTSFIQDYTGMLNTAISGLIDLIQEKKKQIKILLPPFRRDGET
jgi:DNA-binding LacI/PurR family transcriptional regulator